MPKVKVKAQEDLFIKRVRNPRLEGALEAREDLKERRGKIQARFKEQDDVVKGILNEMQIDGDGIRVGAFIITTKEQPGRAVTFETGPRKVVRITKEA